MYPIIDLSMSIQAPDSNTLPHVFVLLKRVQRGNTCVDVAIRMYLSAGNVAGMGDRKDVVRRLLGWDANAAL